MKRFLAILCVSMITLQAQDTPPLLRAMLAELERSKQLRLLGLVPYYIEYAVEDQESTSVQASLGGILNARQSITRVPLVGIRVGTAEKDQTNQIFAGIYSGSRYDSETLPLDDNLDLIRQNLWLATDRTYKSAVESMSAKEQILKSTNVTDPQPDFWKSEAVVNVTKAARNKVDLDSWKSRTAQISRAFLGYPEVLASSVEFDSLSSLSHQINSEGTRIRMPDYLTTMRIRAVGQAEDGTVVRDAAVHVAFEDAKLPAAGEMEKTARTVAENVKALVKAPIGESYSGPVLFEPEAAAQLFSQLLGDNFRNPRRPLSDPGRNVPFQPSEFDGKIGSRILPDSFDVIDDATQTAYEGHALMGYYYIDTESVRPKPVQLIEKGVLKSFLRTRQPLKGFTESTGHARLSGNFGHKSAAIGNLFIKSRDTKPFAELKKQFVDLLKQRNKPYGILVRKMDYPSSGSVSDLQALFASHQQSGSTTRPLAPLVLVYRVYAADGREELIRNVRLKNVSTRAMRDILAASSETAKFDFVNNNAPFALMSWAGYQASATIVAPGVLFEEMEIDRIQDQTVKPPVTPAPALR
jgi:TldD protein